MNATVIAHGGVRHSPNRQGSLLVNSKHQRDIITELGRTISITLCLISGTDKPYSTLIFILALIRLDNERIGIFSCRYFADIKFFVISGIISQLSFFKHKYTVQVIISCLIHLQRHVIRCIRYYFSVLIIINLRLCRACSQAWSNGNQFIYSLSERNTRFCISYIYFYIIDATVRSFRKGIIVYIAFERRTSGTECQNLDRISSLILLIYTCLHGTCTGIRISVFRCNQNSSHFSNSYNLCAFHIKIRQYLRLHCIQITYKRCRKQFCIITVINATHFLSQISGFSCRNSY